MQQIQSSTSAGGAGARARGATTGDQPTTQGALANRLYCAGMGDEAIGRVLRTIGALRIRAHWYAGGSKYRRPRDTSESETTAQLVLPLLQALGWTAQQTAVEWRCIDIALFRRLPREDQHVDSVVEVKRFGTDCFKAKSQALGYAAARPNCMRVVLTDGICYGVYLRRRGRFRLHAYLDLERPCDAYPRLRCLGAKDALLALLP
jgi:hypothetical protein